MKGNTRSIIYHHRGITLIELMIVVVILAILVGVAYPTYQEQIRKSRRSDCHNALMEIAMIQERFHDEFGAYTATIVGAFGAGGGLGLSAQSSEGLYDLSARRPPNGNNQTYLATCTPVAGGFQDGDRCGNLTINHMSEKGHGVAGTLEQCW